MFRFNQVEPFDINIGKCPDVFECCAAAIEPIRVA